MASKSRTARSLATSKEKEEEKPVKSSTERKEETTRGTSSTRKRQSRKRATSRDTNSSRGKGDVQTSIREYFPVRRSSRKCKSVVEEEKFQEMKDKLLSKDEEGLKVEDIEGKGRGVKATRPFTRGELVCEYFGNLISYEEAKKKEAEYEKDEEVGCYMYYFEYKNEKKCVDATDPKIERLGRLINHSKKDANIVTKLVEVDDHPYLCLMAARDIKEGEELQYDYGERSKAAIDSHPWLNN